MRRNAFTLLVSAVLATAPAAADEGSRWNLEDWHAPAETAAAEALRGFEVRRWSEEARALRVEPDNPFASEETDEVHTVRVPVWPGVIRETRTVAAPVFDSPMDAHHRLAVAKGPDVPFAIMSISVLRAFVSDYEQECKRMGGALVPGGCVAPYDLVQGIYETR